MVTFDIKEHRVEEYYQYIMGEFLPRAQSLGLMLTDVYQTAYGEYPARMITFVAKDEETMNTALESDVWDSIETKLDEYVFNYEKRIVQLKKNFQFFLPKSLKR
jgi:hypothetical protein